MFHHDGTPLEGPYLVTVGPYVKSGHGNRMSTIKRTIKDKTVCQTIIMCPAVRLIVKKNEQFRVTLTLI